MGNSKLSTDQIQGDINTIGKYSIRVRVKVRVRVRVQLPMEQLHEIRIIII